MNLGFSGRKHTEETKRKMSEETRKRMTKESLLTIPTLEEKINAQQEI